MTPEELQAIRDRASFMTDPGPWLISYSPDHDRDPIIHLENDEAVATVHGYSWDAEFIAGARQDIPALLAEVDRLQAILQTARIYVAPLVEPHSTMYRMQQILEGGVQ